MDERNDVPPADSADAKSDPQPADASPPKPIEGVLPDGTPYIELGHREDGTPIRVMKPADAAPRPTPLRPKSVDELREWIERRRSWLLDFSDAAVLKVWPGSVADLLDGARSLGLAPPPMPFPVTFTDRQHGLANLDMLLRWLAALEALPQDESKRDRPPIGFALAASVEKGVTDAPPATESERPMEYLLSWREILDCLKLKNNKETRNRVTRLSKEHDGPIIIPGQGGQPKAERQKLIEWWNRLEILWQDKANQQAGKRMSGEAQHKYGASGTVAPEVGGGVKKRRRDRKP